MTSATPALLNASSSSTMMPAYPITKTTMSDVVAWVATQPVLRLAAMTASAAATPPALYTSSVASDFVCAT